MINGDVKALATFNLKTTRATVEVNEILARYAGMKRKKRGFTRQNNGLDV